MGWPVAKRPKKKTDEKPRQDEAAEEEKDELYTAMARLRPDFQRKLARVAKDAKMKVGELIEAQMGDMVTREYRRIVLAEAAELEDE